MASEILERQPKAAEFRVFHGSGPLQFGDLRLPALEAGSRAPVVVFIHGGWWKSAYTLEYGGHLCEALRDLGLATWSLEYRRVGDEGGGFPGTFEDVAAGFDFLEVLAKTHPLDLNRVVVVGHSAGGCLAFWLAGRPNIPAASSLALTRPVIAIRTVVGLAGALDLRMTIDLAGELQFAHSRDEVCNLMGGLPADSPERYAAANPGELLPLDVEQIVLQGSEDDEIPLQLPLSWAERGRRRGEQVTVEILPDAGHLDLVDPERPAWLRVKAAIVKAAG